jgi:hypothetical protein
MYSSPARMRAIDLDHVGRPREPREEVEQVAPVVEGHREAEPQSKGSRDVDHSRRERCKGGKRELTRPAAVAIQAEPHRPDDEAQPEEVQRIAENRMPVAEKELGQRGPRPRRRSAHLALNPCEVFAPRRPRPERQRETAARPPRSFASIVSVSFGGQRLPKWRGGSFA